MIQQDEDYLNILKVGIIYENFNILLTNKEEYDKMSKASNPYGDGFASKKIADILEATF